MQKSKNENMQYETCQQIQHALREQGFEDTEVSKEITYLVEKRYIKRREEKGTALSFGGKSKFKYTTIEYSISGDGRDHLHGSSNVFLKPPSYGININNIHGAVAIGDNNTLIVNDSNVGLVNELKILGEAILKSNQINDEEKREYIADIETIRNQVAKKKPNLNIVGMAWKAIEKLGSIESLIQFYIRVKPFIDTLLQYQSSSQ